MITSDDDIAELLSQRVLAARQVTTLIGDRLRPDALDPGERLPAVVYETLSTDPHYHLEGEAESAQTRVQFTAYGATRREANLVARAIRDVLAGFAGTLGDADAPVYVFDCMRDNDYTRSEPPRDGAESWRYRRVQDFIASHTIPAPTLELE